MPGALAASIRAIRARLVPDKKTAGAMVRLVLSLGLLWLYPGDAPAWGWGNEGHKVIARLAAAHLNAKASAEVALILGARNKRSAVAGAMAYVSVWPDRLRHSDRETASWHFIDLCLQDDARAIAARCNHGCVVEKIEEYRRRLAQADYDRFGARGDLSFLIHLVGDLAQPLHAATNDDRGGTCIPVIPQRYGNLHRFWDDGVVEILEAENRGGSKALARSLNRRFARSSVHLTWTPDSAPEMALRSHQIALTQIYEPLGIQEQPCSVNARGCATTIPAVTLTPAYQEQASQVAARQLVDGGLQLAALLNSIWH